MNNPNTGRASQPEPSPVKNLLRNPTAVTIISLLLPFAGWAAGAFVNPRGWASDAPLVVLVGIIGLYEEFLPILIVGAAALVLIGLTLGYRVLSLVLLALSVIYTAFIFHLVATASEDEFA